MSTIAIGDTVTCPDTFDTWIVKHIWKDECALGDLAELVGEHRATIHHEPVVNLSHVTDSVESLFDCE